MANDPPSETEEQRLAELRAITGWDLNLDALATRAAAAHRASVAPGVRYEYESAPAKKARAKKP